LASIDTKKVAPFILTKAVGPIDPAHLKAVQKPDGVPLFVDLAPNYKYPEGSAAERAAINAAHPDAVRERTVSYKVYGTNATDEATRWSVASKGEPFVIHIEGSAKEDVAASGAGNKTISGRVEVYAVTYTGNNRVLVADKEFASASLYVSVFRYSVLHSRMLGCFWITHLLACLSQQVFCPICAS
jgi:hypothetical protein